MKSLRATKLCRSLTSQTHQFGVERRARKGRAAARSRRQGHRQNRPRRKTRARDEALKQKIENDKMARLYREHVLGEKKIEGFVPLDGLLGSISPKPAPIQKQEAEKREEVGAMGD